MTTNREFEVQHQQVLKDARRERFETRTAPVHTAARRNPGRRDPRQFRKGNRRDWQRVISVEERN
jgi:hypothetical protein